MYDQRRKRIRQSDQIGGFLRSECSRWNLIALFPESFERTIPCRSLLVVGHACLAEVLQPFECANQIQDSRFLCDGKLAWDIEHPAPMIVPMLKVLSGNYHFGQALPGV